ncbi:MAG: alpha/beta fold hydrolase [Caulobacter sp.]|nr:alpha/beta fold hydrolase [Caulobacter sp.]
MTITRTRRGRLRRCARSWIGVVLATFLAVPAAVAAPSDDGFGPLERRTVVDRSGRKITYYVSHPDHPAPIMLLIQGSGCQPVMARNGGQFFSTLFSLLPVASEGRFTVVAVEKPFANADTAARPCSAAFNEDFTADSWREALAAGLGAARALPWVDQRRTLVFGHSEGAVMAALLAARDPSITDVVAIGMTGDTQLFDFVTLAYQRKGGTAVKLQGVDDVYGTVRDILANPDSATEMAWGHPYRRWSSFFRTSVVDALLASKARLYLAAGTQDASVPILSTELAIARLTLAGRDLTVRRVADANHSLMYEGDTTLNQLDEEYGRARKWFWKSGPTPGAAACPSAACPTSPP